MSSSQANTSSVNTGVDDAAVAAAQGSSSNDKITSELYFLIAHFLNNSPFNDVAKSLIQRLEDEKVLPKRYDWLGNSHSRSFQELSEQSRHIPPNFLLQMCNQLRLLMDQQLNNNFSSVNSILGSGQYSVLQDLEASRQRHKTHASLAAADSIPRGLYSKYSTKAINLVLNLNDREINSKMSPQTLLQPEFYKTCNTHKRILGHLSAVYCVCFDRTGRYILTGADDNLIKIWSALDGRLLATLRGHEKEISDIDVNFENTLLASGSCDKTIRIWNLKTIESTTVLNAHSSMVTSVEFSPRCHNDNRWLASSGNDGAVCFWQWNVKTMKFIDKPRKFIEKSRSGAQMLCISFSAGGSFLAAGSNDHVIRVYFFENDCPTKICELESHSNFVDSIQYSNHSTRFVSGSKDGTARVWKYERKQWKALLIDASKTHQKNDDDGISLDAFKKHSVTMVTWNSDDSLVVTAQNNFLIKVWNSNDARLVHELKGHTDEVYVLEAHPKDPRLLLSAGHDGLIIFWNLLTGKLIKKIYNKIENEGHGCLFDAKWSPLSDMFATTDSHGYLSLFGFGGDDKFRKVPNEQFFHTDYRPLMRDGLDFVLDEQTQTPTHLMPPAFLVNADGHPYPIEFQRLVPGRENLSDLQLNPHVVVNDRGVQEIIGDLEEENASLSVDDTQLRTQNRRRNLWKKNFIQELETEILRTDEDNRQEKLKEEEEYINSEYQKGSIDFSRTSLDSSQNDNQSKRGRGRGRGSKREKNLTEIVCKNRLTTRALYDTDGEEEEEANVDVNSDNEDIYEQFENEEESLDVVDHDDDDEDSKQPIATRSHTVAATRNSAYVMAIEEMDDEASESSEYSDWEEEEGRQLRPPPTRTRREKRGRKRIKIKEEDDDEDAEVDVEADEESAKVTRKIRKTRVIHDDDNEEEDADKEEEGEKEVVDYKDVKPSTSSDASPRKGRPPKRVPKVKQDKEPTSKRSKIEKKFSKHTAMKECPPEYRPPEWLTSTKPKKSPYVPQMGDIVVYFRQGHEIYVETVKRDNVYEIEEKSLPWFNSSIELNIIEYCKVVGLKVEIKPPRLVCLKLSVIDSETGSPSSTTFSIKYHDMAGVVDFVILKQIFERAENRSWKPKDRFRCIIDDSWYFGVVESKEPFDENYPESPFQCYNVLWDTGDQEKLSSWDLEPLNAKKSKAPATKLESVPVTDEELKSIIYTPDENEWPSHGRDGECDRILRGLEQIMELSIAEFFNFPVDLDAYPLYAILIGYPIDLNTIKQRLENRYYRRITSIQWDVRIIEANATKFNERKSDIVRQASLLTELMLIFINDTNSANPIAIYKELCKKRDFQISLGVELSNDSNESAVKTEDHYNIKESKRNKSHGRRNKYQHDVDAWKDDCKRLLDTIMQHSDSVPFRAPVDTREFLDYLTIVSEPIDFVTIRNRVLNNHYSDLTQFDTDCKLVFANSKAYNTNKRSRIYGMTLRLGTLYDTKIKEIFNDYESAMKYKKAMTSRYGRKIKLRVAKEPLREFNSTADADSDDARQDFDDNYKRSNHNTRQSSSHYATSLPTTSAMATASNSYDGPSHMTRSASNRRLRSSHSVNFSSANTSQNNNNSKAPMAANGNGYTNGHGSVKRSSTYMEKSYYTKDSDDEDDDQVDDDDNDVDFNENSNASSKKQSGSKKHVNNTEHTNGHSAAAANGVSSSHHDESSNYSATRVSTKAESKKVINDDEDEDELSNHANIGDEDYEDDDDDDEEVDEDDEEEYDDVNNKELNSDSSIEFNKKRTANGTKKPLPTSSSNNNKKPRARSRKTSASNSAANAARSTRSSKRNRKQFSYKESSNDSGEEYNSDSCSKRSTASTSRRSQNAAPRAAASNSQNMSLRSTRKKQRRFSPTAVACYD